MALAFYDLHYLTIFHISSSIFSFFSPSSQAFFLFDEKGRQRLWMYICDEHIRNGWRKSKQKVLFLAVYKWECFACLVSTLSHSASLLSDGVGEIINYQAFNSLFGTDTRATNTICFSIWKCFMREEEEVGEEGLGILFFHLSGRSLFFGIVWEKWNFKNNFAAICSKKCF